MNGSLDQYPNEQEQYFVTVREYSLENGEYFYTGVDRNFTTNSNFQIVERVVPIGLYNAFEHVDYYAVDDVWGILDQITWTGVNLDLL